jgi:hypothetical protein
MQSKKNASLAHIHITKTWMMSGAMKSTISDAEYSNYSECVRSIITERIKRMMPKLIDRTNLEKDMNEWIKQYGDPVDLSADVNDLIVSTLITIGDQPIVDAIPVEWLANLSKQESLLGHWELSSHIDRIIEAWRKQKNG